MKPENDLVAELHALTMQVALVLTAAAAASAAAPCTAATKQKALYLSYDFEPSLRHTPALDILVYHTWTSLSDLHRYGKNGVYAAQPIGSAYGVGGYFGSQVVGSSDNVTLLFSVWDKQVAHTPAKNVSECLSAGGPNTTWCSHQHAFPLAGSCRRHCLDCGLHPGWHNTTGTQCSINLAVAAQQTIRFRLRRVVDAGSIAASC